ncbi:hypothetical protein BHECKSOX_1301, partial [Bathymodiolus heckerae thiotrophic gill symbiont]|uniref:DUF805 domain-containing protein n=1 Tax=Bathymodiolus heckerae thiotrophic gill symbiont TaxID=1052212 RepID=UPI0010B28726
MTFVESINTVVFKKYANFNGRASRSEYWWYALFMFLIQILAMTLFSNLYSYQEYNPIKIIISLALFLPSLGVNIRRLHDTNKSGWWLLSPLAIGAIFGALAYILTLIGEETSAIFLVAISIGITNLYLFYLMLK